MKPCRSSAERDSFFHHADPLSPLHDYLALISASNYQRTNLIYMVITHLMAAPAAQIVS